MNTTYSSRYYACVALLNITKHCLAIGISAVFPSPFLSSPLQNCVESSSMFSMRLVLLIAAFVASMAALTTGSRSTRRPKPQITKKPPRGSGSNGAGGGGFVPAIAVTSLPSMHTEETTEVMLDTHSFAPKDSTTYSINTYPTDFHVDAITPPGNPLENYTLEYNECFLNICECCSLVKGIIGPMGERGPPGPPGQRGPVGKVDYCFHKKKKYI